MWKRAERTLVFLGSELFQTRELRHTFPGKCWDVIRAEIIKTKQKQNFFLKYLLSIDEKYQTSGMMGNLSVLTSRESLGQRKPFEKWGTEVLRFSFPRSKGEIVCSSRELVISFLLLSISINPASPHFCSRHFSIQSHGGSGNSSCTCVAAFKFPSF